MAALKCKVYKPIGHNRKCVPALDPRLWEPWLEHGIMHPVTKEIVLFPLGRVHRDRALRELRAMPA